MWRVVVLVCALVAAGAGQETEETESKVVTITQGQIRGYKAANYDVFEFLNVPYALAPTGTDKFKAPYTVNSVFMGVFPAVDRGILCPQSISALFPDDSPLNFKEDCLVANIHVPNTNETNLPVLVIVHGGAYLLGAGIFQKANGLASDANIIVVTFNYRLGPHGFLCLGTDDAPGNAGMKDQVALLRWVQTNIAGFGGNPNDVTISGCSAGGSSVDLLMLSNMTDGLFNKVIAESGCSINPFSTQINPIQNARDYAQSLGFTNANVSSLEDLAEFYTTIPLSNLFSSLLDMASTKNSYFTFQPCVEANIGQQRFLEDAPINVLKSGNFKNLPVIYGYAKHEGLFRIMQLNEWTVAMNEDFSQFLPANLQFENETQKVEVANMVKEFYFGPGEISESSVSQYINYFTDVVFLSGILRSVSLRVGAGQDNIYLYEYSFTHNESTSIPNADDRGADHCDQFDILLDHSIPESLSEERTNMSQTMREIISNFISTGNPTPSESSLPTWPPVASANRFPHYSIGDTIQVAGIPVESRGAFWDAIYDVYEAIPQQPVENEPEAEPTTTETPEDEITTTDSYDEETTTETAEDEETTTETAEDEETTTETYDDQETTTEAYGDDETTTEADDVEPTTEGYNSANNIFSHQLWMFFTVVAVIAFK
ncbi:esterase FE4-like [Ostrinia furnacalis]|uniref:esterase FE4-like n=1 Tax=Ostrinia furnacalis TaxID=93504 RepID=UPI0010401E66|nr:esterase FE4-like [Ostrinia furnacalis]